MAGYYPSHTPRTPAPRELGDCRRALAVRGYVMRRAGSSRSWEVARRPGIPLMSPRWWPAWWTAPRDGDAITAFTVASNLAW
jgi:hypothetical protein